MPSPSVIPHASMGAEGGAAKSPSADDDRVMPVTGEGAAQEVEESGATSKASASDSAGDATINISCGEGGDTSTAETDKTQHNVERIKAELEQREALAEVESLQSQLVAARARRNAATKKIKAMGPIHAMGPWETAWTKHYVELVKYKREHGHCKPKKETELGRWCWRQRQRYKVYRNGVKGKKCMGRYAEARIRLLEELGFDWNYEDNRSNWNDLYKELVEYRSIHGNCNVRQDGDQHKLGDFVQRMRKSYQLRLDGVPETKVKAAKLTDERKTLLDDIGFVWRQRARRRKRNANGELVGGEGSSSAPVAKNRKVDEKGEGSEGSPQERPGIHMSH